ncbi:hypothetical protein ACJIZ3_020248 [Penstemon smallii]|uniref:RRM domain-containing protein n=1 Tax=Penstemon smallii TaxID=265156 RepID=A0ABD3SI67_9LAMI
MLSLVKFPTQVQCNINLCQNLHFPSKPYSPFCTHLNYNAFPGKIRTGFPVKALKTQKKGEFTLPEMDGPDEFEDDFDDEFLGDENEDDDEFLGDDDDEIVVPLENMKKWLESRPRGFGEGKVYDTVIEDKLMEEIEQSRKAQISNVNKLKNERLKPSTKSTQKDKAIADILDGFRVRIVNLPKKKNIHKDLKLAFKGIPGIVNIVPLVSGNEKTRDPVCKGLAFVDFKYKDDAHRFVQNFSGESVSFGKVQKKIKCEIMDPKLPKALHEQSVNNTDGTLQRRITNLDKDLNTTGIDSDISIINSLEENAIVEQEYEEGAIVEQKYEDDREIKETSSTSEFSLAEEKESEIGSSSLKKGRKPKSDEKKVASKRKKDKNPKLKIPGSANRLKTKDKTMLTGVFSKYGSNANLAAAK